MLPLDDPHFAHGVLKARRFPHLKGAVDSLLSAPDPARIPPAKMQRIRDTLLAYLPDFTNRRIAAQTLRNEGLAPQDTLMAPYESAAVILCDQMAFSDGFRTHLYDHLGASLGKPDFEGDWQQASLMHKVNHCTWRMNDFLENYDPHFILHNPATHNTVTIDTLRKTEDVGVIASYGFAKGVTFKRYFTVLDDQNLLDPEETDRQYDALSGKMCFDVDCSWPGHDLHVQYNERSRQVGFTSLLADEKDTMQILGHELCHLVVGRLRLVAHNHDASFLESALHYTGRDHRLAELSAFCTGIPNKTHQQYRLNKEEQLAFGAEKIIAETWPSAIQPK